ncbi:hypothetical protein PG984_007230 [Apiospora sp. TS-2023a]
MIVASALALISASGLAFAADFRQNCPEVNLWQPSPWLWYLNATCWGSDLNLACTSLGAGFDDEIDYNGSCYVDNGGALQPKANGLGLRNCKSCSILGNILTCQCSDFRGNFPYTYTDLERILHVSPCIIIQHRRQVNLPLNQVIGMPEQIPQPIRRGLDLILVEWTRFLKVVIDAPQHSVAVLGYGEGTALPRQARKVQSTLGHPGRSRNRERRDQVRTVRGLPRLHPRAHAVLEHEQVQLQTREQAQQGADVVPPDLAVEVGLEVGPGLPLLVLVLICDVLPDLLRVQGQEAAQHVRRVHAADRDMAQDQGRGFGVNLAADVQEGQSRVQLLLFFFGAGFWIVAVKDEALEQGYID